MQVQTLPLEDPRILRAVYRYLGGGFEYSFIFTPNPREMIQFHEHIFQMGWFNHQPDTDEYSIYRCFFSKGNIAYPWEGTVAVKHYPMLADTTIIESIYRYYIGGICWYISRVLSQGYPTFPFDFLLDLFLPFR